MDAENNPDPLLIHPTVPVGDLPVTVAVHLEDEPTATGDGEQTTEVPEVEARAEGALGRMKRNTSVVDTTMMNIVRETAAHLRCSSLPNLSIPAKSDARQS